jgi:hypothetical protein
MILSEFQMALEKFLPIVSAPFQLNHYCQQQPLRYLIKMKNAMPFLHLIAFAFV